MARTTADRACNLPPTLRQIVLKAVELDLDAQQLDALEASLRAQDDAYQASQEAAEARDAFFASLFAGTAEGCGAQCGPDCPECSCIPCDSCESEATRTIFGPATGDVLARVCEACHGRAQEA